MRLALALAVLTVTIGQARPQSISPPKEIDGIVRAYVVVNYADIYCSKYKMDNAQVEKLLRDHDLTQADIDIKYHDYVIDVKKKMSDLMFEGQDQFCDVVYDQFGNIGYIPHLVVRR